MYEFNLGITTHMSAVLIHRLFYLIFVYFPVDHFQLKVIDTKQWDLRPKIYKHGVTFVTRSLFSANNRG